MDVYLAIVSKREVRAYADRPLPDDAVRRLHEAGRVAGSSRNRQARRFIVLRDDALARAAETVWAPENLRRRAGGRDRRARQGPDGLRRRPRRQNMMLAAQGDGIARAQRHRRPGGARRRSRPRRQEQVTTVISFGYPARPVDPESRTPDEWIERANRLAFDDIVEARS
jgi:nitroreductase